MSNKTVILKAFISSLAFILVLLSTPALSEPLHFEEDNSFWPGSPAPEDANDRYTWQRNVTDDAFNFKIKGDDFEKEPAALTLNFFPTSYPTRVKVSVNGADLGSFVKNCGQSMANVHCPSGILKAGKNVLKLEQSGAFNRALVNLYGDAFDSLDVTFGTEELRGPSATNAGVPAPAFSRNQAENKNKTFKPISPRKDTGQDGILDEEGDYLILTYSGFINPLEQLGNLRAGQGFTVRIVTPEQIYAVFPPGEPPDYASSVKSFISYAYHNWELKPRYVLLVGCWGSGPSLPEYPEHEKFPAYFYYHPNAKYAPFEVDDWFVDVVGDDFIPDIAIGRIPAWTVGQVWNYVTKVDYYEAHQNPGWKDNTLVTLNDTTYWDDRVGDPEDPEFLEYQEQIRSYGAAVNTLLSRSYNTDELRSEDYGSPWQRWLAFKGRLEAGKAIGFFFGYSGNDTLGQFLNYPETGTTADLTNTGKYPIFVGSGCVNNSWWPGPDEEYPSLGMVPNFILDKGFVSVIGPSNDADVSEIIGFVKFFANYLARGTDVRLGDIYCAAKRAVLTLPERGADKKMNYYIQLAGDPALRVLGSRDCFPVLLPGWPRYTYDSGAHVVVADITPDVAQGEQFDGLTEPPYRPDPVGEGPQDVVGRDDTDLYAWTAGGAEYFWDGVPPYDTLCLLADIDNDGILDIVSNHSAVHLLSVRKKDGSYIENFPVEIPQLMGYAPAVGDMNGDGYLDIVCVGGESAASLYAVDHTGQILPGWPKAAPGGWYFWNTPSIGDVDNDAELEAVITYSGGMPNDPGRLIVVSHSNNVEQTLEFGGSIKPCRAVLADIDADPELEIVVGCEKIAPLDAEIDNLFVLDRNLAGQYQVLWQGNTEGCIKYPPCVGDFRSQHEGKEIIVVTSGWYPSPGEVQCWLAATGVCQNSCELYTDPTSAPTVADVCEDPGPPGYEVLFGEPSKLACHRAWYTMDPVPGWNGALKDSVTTPLVTDLDGNGSCDIVCSDAEGVYAFTTNRPYAGLENFDWVRDGHDNLNMGLWDIAAPTGVVAEDYADDQGGKIVIAWTPSVDNGVRSSRVNEYEIYLGIAPPGGDGDSAPGRAARAKLAEGKRAAA